MSRRCDDAVTGTKVSFSQAGASLRTGRTQCTMPDARELVFVTIIAPGARIPRPFSVRAIPRRYRRALLQPTAGLDQRPVPNLRVIIFGWPEVDSGAAPDMSQNVHLT